jgi:hypothetical protein
MANKVPAVQGGTLIDGTGRPPVENAVVVIEGGRFKAVGKQGQVPVPADAPRPQKPRSKAGSEIQRVWISGGAGPFTAAQSAKPGR